MPWIAIMVCEIAKGSCGEGIPGNIENNHCEQMRNTC